MATTDTKRAASGIAGLDTVTCGGFVTANSHLVRGGAGTGKTTLGLHFLHQGAKEGQACLLVTLGEPEVRLRQNAARLGIDLSEVSVLDLSPTSDHFTENRSYNLFSPSDVERVPLAQRIIEAVETTSPVRMVIDTVTQLRYLSQDAFQFRQQMLSLLRYLDERGATVVLVSEAADLKSDEDLQFMSDAVIDLDYTDDVRELSVRKFRGSSFAKGGHAFELTPGGMEVFPRLVPDDFHGDFSMEPVSSGNENLDLLMGGGLERGTVSIISGPTGVGKTTLGTMFLCQAATRGEHAVLYTFEESREGLLTRCDAIGLPVRKLHDSGLLRVNAVEPLRYTPDEFAHLVRHEVEAESARAVMVDSTSGYRLSLRGQNLQLHVHGLARYLANMGVTALLVAEVRSIIGDFKPTEAGISYLADNIVFLRYLELEGELKKAVGVLKKRLTDFEHTMREFEITSQGVRVGSPMTGMRGLLTGLPELIEAQ